MKEGLYLQGYIKKEKNTFFLLYDKIVTRRLTKSSLMAKLQAGSSPDVAGYESVLIAFVFISYGFMVLLHSFNYNLSFNLEINSVAK